MAFNVGALTATLGFRVDDDGADKFERRIRTLRGDAAKPVTAELRGDLNPRDLDLYEKKLNELRAKVARRDAFKAQLGANYDSRAFSSMERDLRRVDRQSENTVRSQGRLRTAFGQVSGAGLGMFAAAGGGYAIFQGLKSIVTASGEAETAQRSLEAQLKAIGPAAQAHSKEIDAVIQKHSLLAGVDDEDLSKAFVSVARATDSASKAMNAMGLVTDIARARNMDVAKAGDLVGKVMAGNTGVLARYGIVLKDNATTEEAVAALRQKFAGQAEAFGKTQTGALERLGVAWENLQETLGEKLAPTLTKVANKAAEFVTQMTEGKGQGGEFVDTLESIWRWLKRVAGVGEDVTSWLKENRELVKLAATAWVGYKLAVLGANAATKASLLLGGGVGKGGKGGIPPVAPVPAAGRVGAGRVVAGAGGIAATILAVKTATDFLTDKSDLGLLDQYADKLERVAKTGDSKGMRDLAGQLRETARANSDITKGKHLELFAKALDDTARNGGKDLGALQDAFKRMAKSSGGSLEDLRKEFANVKKGADFNFGAVRDETRETREAFQRMKKSTADNMDQIRATVRSRARDIKDDLGKNSEEGRAALADNFQRARRAVVRQMGGAENVTKKGMEAIRGFLSDELRLYGFTVSQARQYVRGRDATGHRPVTTQSPVAGGGQRGMKFMQGGWLGAKGMIGADTIEVAPGYWAAPGEYYAKGPAGHGAVINRHQAPLVNLALMRGGHTLDSLPRDVSALPRIEAALRDFGGLDAVFSAVRRPHMLQGGGNIVPVPGFPGERANRSILDEIAWVTRRFGVTLTDAFGPGHKSPGHTVMGTAADFAGSDSAMDSAVRALVRAGYLVGYDGRFGSQAWPGHGPSSAAGSNAHLHVEFGTRGGTPLTMTTIPRFQIKGGGMAGAAAQAALDLARGGAQNMLDAASAGALAMPIGGGGRGGSVNRNKALARGLLGSFGWGLGQFSSLDRLWTGESGWNENAVNPSSGAGGIPQALPASKMGPGWQGNALQQIRWGLGYIKGRYGTPAAAYSAWQSRSPHWYQSGGHTAQGVGSAPGHGRASTKPRKKVKPRPGRVRSQYLKGLIGFADIFEDQLSLAALTPGKEDDLTWLQRLEGVYGEITTKAPASVAADYAPQLISTREAIAEILAPPVADVPSAPTEIIREPTPEEIAQGVAAQLASFQAARASLFSAYGSNFTLAGQPFVPSTAMGQAAGLRHFGAGTSGQKIINQTNVFPTPPPEPHLFARLTLHDLQAAP